MKITRIVAAVATAALIPLGLAACSTAGATTASSAKTKTAITIEDYYTPPSDPEIDKIYSQCAAETNTKITVDHVAGAALIAKVLQQESSKTLPDVLMLDNPDVQQIAQSGALSPLSDYGISGKGAAKAAASAGTYKGTLYGLEPVTNSIALFYNTDILKAANITPPRTWAELTQDAKELTTSTRYGFAFSGINTFEGTWQFMPFMWSNGGNEKDLNSSENVQTLSFLTDLINDGSTSKSVVGWTQTDVNNQFIAGKAAMMINGPWQIPLLDATKGLHWSYVQIPTRLSSQVSQAPLGGEAFTVPNTGSKTKMAAGGKFVSCLLSPSKETANAKANDEIPSNNVAAAAYAKANPGFAPFVNIIKNARSRTALLGPAFPAAATKIYTAEQLAFTGKASPADAFSQAASASQ